MVGVEIFLRSASLNESGVAVLLNRADNQPDDGRRIRSLVDMINISGALKV